MPTSPEIINRTAGKQYIFNRLSKDNLPDLATLHREVYGTARHADYFIKKYHTAYTGVENVGFIAYNEGNQPIAYYGVIPCFLQSGNEIILSAQSADTMTHPDHRNKGLFVELSNRTFDLCKELSIKLIFGFPNQHSYQTFINRLGWTETEKMNRFSIQVNTAWTSFFLKPSQKRYEKIINQLLIPGQGIANSVIADGYIGVCRNEGYLQYKTYTATSVIKINSGYLWIKPGNELTIGDILLTGDNHNNFIEEVKTLAKKLNVNKISFQCSGDSSLHKLFTNHCTANPSFPVIFKDFGSGLPLEKIKFTFADIDIF